MNISEFIEYFKRFGSVPRLPRHPMRERWEDVSKPISDHLHGIQNARYLSNFPNEDDAIKAYRCQLWRADTKAVLLPAVDDLQRVLKSSKYSIHFTNDRIKQQVESKAIPQKFIRRITTRIAQPNSHKIWWPNENQVSSEENTTLVDFNLLDISYKRIINVTDEFIIFFADGVNCENYTKNGNWVFDFFDGVHYDNMLPDGTKTRTVLNVITNEAYIKVDKNEKGEYLIYQVYEHNYNGIPGVANGGRETLVICPKTHKTFIVYESDFCAALAPLDNMELYANQTKSVQLNNAFPIKFIQGSSCETCQGKGVTYCDEHDKEYDVNNPDKTKKCGDCFGGYRMPLSPLIGYKFRQLPAGATAEDRKIAALQQPIEQGATNVDMCAFVNELYKEARKEAIETLNIYRQTNFAQSGESKDQDKDGAKTQAERIGEDVFMRVEILLMQYQALTTGDNESPITITRSINTNIDNEKELFETFKEAIKSCPIGMRHAAYMDLIGRRFSTNKEVVRVETLAAKYAKTLYLASQEERDRIKASGLPGIVRECMKAIYVNTLLCKIDNIETKEDNAIFAELDKKIDELFAAQEAQTAAELIDA